MDNKYNTNKDILNQKGAAALLTVIIISAAVLIMAFNSSLLGMGELDLGYTSQKGSESLALADGCIESALRRLRLDQNYSGGTLSIENDSCIISIESSGNNRTIIATSTVDLYYKVIKVEATLSGSNTTINYWKEL